MRDYYYALCKDHGLAAMSLTYEEDPNPPIVIFESPEVAERYRHEIAGDDWEVLESNSDEVVAGTTLMADASFRPLERDTEPS